MTNPFPPQRYQLLFLRAHLRLHINPRMRHSRMSGTRLLSLTSAQTGKKYKRGQYDQALADVDKMLEEITQ